VCALFTISCKQALTDVFDGPRITQCQHRRVCHVAGALRFHTYLILELYGIVVLLPLHQDISPSAPDSDNPSTSPCELLGFIMAHDSLEDRKVSDCAGIFSTYRSRRCVDSDTTGGDS
jgi:hypothetical protein